VQFDRAIHEDDEFHNELNLNELWKTLFKLRIVDVRLNEVYTKLTRAAAQKGRFIKNTMGNIRNP